MKLRLKAARFKKWNAMNDDERGEFVSWLVTTCRAYGAPLSTSLRVAAEFVRGLEGLSHAA